MKKEKDDYPLNNYLYSLVILCFLVDMFIDWLYGDNPEMTSAYIVMDALPILLLLLILVVYMVYETLILRKALKDEDGLWHKISFIRFGFVLALCIALGVATWMAKEQSLVDFWQLLQSCC